MLPGHGCYRTGPIACTAKKSSMSAVLTPEGLLKGTTMQFKTVLQN